MVALHFCIHWSTHFFNWIFSVNAAREVVSDLNSEIGKFSFGKSLFIGKLVQSEHDSCQKSMEQLKFVLVIKL